PPAARPAPEPDQIAAPAGVLAQLVASGFAAAPKQPGGPVQTAVIAAGQRHGPALPVARPAPLPALPARRPGALALLIRALLSGVARPDGLHRHERIQIPPATAP